VSAWAGRGRRLHTLGRMEGESQSVDRASRVGWGTWVGLAAALAGIGLIALIVITVDPLRNAFSDAIGGDTSELRQELDNLGAGGPLIVLALCLIHAFVWYPAEIVDTAAGFAFGFWASVPLVMAGWLANALITYWLGRALARPVLARAVGERRFGEAERMIAGGGATLLLAARLVPVVPFSLTGYVAGAARVPPWRFMWTTAVGYLPLTVIFIYVGSRLDSFSPTDPLILAGAAVLVGLLLLARRLRIRTLPRAPDGGDG
jgi:uncharacterized membrane protein YdjX (TVP38/TMEM64 family)